MCFGIIVGNNTYLRDAWNVLDVVIVVMSGLSLFTSDESHNASAARILRVMRPVTSAHMIALVQPRTPSLRNDNAPSASPYDGGP